MTPPTTSVGGSEAVRMSASERPVILLGCPRSGTTLLRVMLNAHSRIAIPPETRFVIPAYERRHRFGSLSRPAARRRLARFVVRRKPSRFRYLGLDPQQTTDAIVGSELTALGEAFDLVFAEFAASRGKARWGDKRPAYYSFVDELAALFPAAQFVHLVRDGRACAASLKRPPFGYSRARAITTWLNAMHSCRQSGRRLGPGRYHELRYEDLVQDTEKQLRDLCAFLGEEFEQPMLRPEQVVDENVPAGFQQKVQIAAGVNPGSLEKWRTELSAGEVRSLELLGRRALTRHGYRLAGGSGVPAGLVLTCLARHLRYRLLLRTTRGLDRLADVRGVGRVGRGLLARYQPRRRLLR